VYLVQVSLLLIGQQGFGHVFPLAGGSRKFYANAGGKRPMQCQPLLVQYKQHANPLLPMNNYSSNDKNKRLTLLSQRKLALTAKKTLFA
jgi:hypothetical protein